MADTKEAVLMVPVDLRQALAELARQTGASQEVLLREAIELFLIEQQRPMPSSIGMANDPDLSGADSEDWLAANWHPS